MAFWLLDWHLPSAIYMPGFASILRLLGFHLIWPRLPAALLVFPLLLFLGLPGATLSWPACSIYLCISLWKRAYCSGTCLLWIFFFFNEGLSQMVDFSRVVSNISSYVRHHQRPILRLFLLIWKSLGRWWEHKALDWGEAICKAIL